MGISPCLLSRWLPGTSPLSGGSWGLDGNIHLDGLCSFQFSIGPTPGQACPIVPSATTHACHAMPGANRARPHSKGGAAGGCPPLSSRLVCGVDIHHQSANALVCSCPPTTITASRLCTCTLPTLLHLIVCSRHTYLLHPVQGTSSHGPLDAPLLPCAGMTAAATAAASIDREPYPTPP